MKNFNADSPVVRLRTKQKSLNIELSKLKKEIVSGFGTERKKRDLLKQIATTEKSIEEVNTLIKQEKRNAVKQFTRNTDEMIRTPPKKLNTTFEKVETQIDRQPTELNSDPDMVERNITTKAQTQASSSIPSVAFTITSSTDEPIKMTTSFSTKTTQNEMNRLDRQNLSTNPNMNTINEKSTGVIPKLKRSGRVLDFSEIITTSQNQNAADIYELPRTRRNDDNLNLQFPTTSHQRKGASGILTQMNVFPKSSAEESNSRKELNDFFNIFPPSETQGSNNQNYSNLGIDTLNTNIASNFSTNDLNQEESQFQYPQISPSINNTRLSMQPNTSQNINVDTNMNSPIDNTASIFQVQPQQSQQQIFTQPQYTQYTTLIADTDFPLEESYFENRVHQNLNFAPEHRPERRSLSHQMPLENRSLNRNMPVEIRPDRRSLSHQRPLENRSLNKHMPVEIRPEQRPLNQQMNRQD